MSRNRGESDAVMTDQMVFITSQNHKELIEANLAGLESTICGHALVA